MIAKRHSAEQIARLRARYLEEPETKVETIAFEEGISTSVLAKHCADLPRRSPRLERQRLLAIDLAALGVDMSEIAQRLKMPMRSVRHALAKPPETPEERDAREAAREDERRAVKAARDARRHAERRESSS